MKPITSDQYPLPAKRPRYPVTNKDKIKRVFGVEMPHWNRQLRAFLVALPGAELKNRNKIKRSCFTPSFPGRGGPQGRGG